MKSRFTALVLCAVVALAGLTAWAWVPTDVYSTVCAVKQNAAWIGADWTAEPVNSATIQKLAEDSAHRQLLYLFPFVTYLQADGSFRSRP